jgi:hypothetical protein
VHQAFGLTRGECNHRKGAKGAMERGDRISNLESGIWNLDFRI